MTLRPPSARALLFALQALTPWFRALRVQEPPPPERPNAERPNPERPSIALLAVNAAATNRRSRELGEALARVDADVVVVVELSWHVHDGLIASRLLERYPYRVEDVRDDYFGSAVYSRLPLEKKGTAPLAEQRTVHATIRIDGAPVELVAVHTRQPLADLRALEAQLRELRDYARSAGHPLILAGDFNATTAHRPFRELLDTGLRVAHVERGRKRAFTWPQTHWLPAFALIDHVLVSPEIAVVCVEEVAAPGSDHRAVVARLRRSEIP